MPFLKKVYNDFDGSPYYGDRRMVAAFVITKKIGLIRKWFGRYVWLEEYRGPAAFGYWLPVKWVILSDN